MILTTVQPVHRAPLVPEQQVVQVRAQQADRRAEQAVLVRRVDPQLAQPVVAGRAPVAVVAALQEQVAAPVALAAARVA